MKTSNILLNLVTIGFIFNGSVNVFFATWLRKAMHFPANEFIFSILEIAIGLLIFFRNRFSFIPGNFSRMRGLFWSGLALAGILLLPFRKEFQYVSVKMLGVFYFAFYLFCILALSNKSVKILFPSAAQIPSRPLEESRSHNFYFETPLNEKTVRRISLWIKLIAVALIIDSFSYFFLSFGLKTYLGMTR